MFELLLTVCIQGDPAQCMVRRMPVESSMGINACMMEGPIWGKQWLALHPDLTLKSWRCDSRYKPDPDVTRPFELTEVAPGVHVHTGLFATPTPQNDGDLANLAYIEGDEAIAVIDAGGSRKVAEQFFAAIRQASKKPIRWLILSHMHPDHILGAEVFREAGAKIIGHAKLGRGIEARAETYTNNIRRLIGERAFSGTKVVLPDEGIEDVREIDLGNRVIELKAWPTAHTDNDLTVLDRKTGTWLVGDLVFAQHTPALDGSIKGWIAVLEGMGAQQVARIVPGHGPASLPWPQGGGATLDYLRAIEIQTRAAIAAGETMGNATRHIGKDQAPNWQLFEEFNQRNATTAFKELEWE